MDTQHRPDELAQLRTTVTALHTRLARVERRRRLPRRALPLLLATFLVALVPLATLAANPFTDLVPNSVHNPDIDAIYTAGITTGCVPDAEYCPTDFVTRQEMASFLARTAGLGGNPAVAHAATAVEATTAQSAQDASTIGGYAPGGLVRVGRGPIGAQGTPLTNGYGTVNAVTLEIPAAGYVLVTGTVSVLVATLGESNTQMRLSTPNPNGANSPLISARTGGTEGHIEALPLTQSWVFRVAAAGPRTFNLEVLNTAGEGQVFTSGITALYVPFGPAGGTADPLP